MPKSLKFAVTADDVEDAARCLEGHVVRTPVLSHPWLDEMVGARVLMKAEVLQRTGSFKFRGARNRLSRMTQDERARGVVAWSSGNHGQAVASAAQSLAIGATVVMPSDAPAMKIENTRRFGANVVLYDRYNEVREEIAGEIVRKTGAVPVSPNDDPFVVAGYATVGLEFMQQAASLGTEISSVLAPCGGGGLVAGIGVVLDRHCPKTRVVAVEPEGFDDIKRSVAAGVRLRNDPKARSICDALVAPIPAIVPFPMIQHYVDDILTVSDAEVRHAMRIAYELLKIVVEPGGAVGLAALLAGRLPATAPETGAVGVLLSGGNVDSSLFASILSEPTTRNRTVTP